MHKENKVLKKLVKKYGWPTYSKVGKAGSDAAFVLFIHQDSDLEFQKRVLKETDPLVKTGEVSASYYGQLYDRVMHHEGKKQLYGTQGHCVAKGVNYSLNRFPSEIRKTLTKDAAR